MMVPQGRHGNTLNSIYTWTVLSASGNSRVSSKNSAAILVQNFTRKKERKNQRKSVAKNSPQNFVLSAKAHSYQFEIITMFVRKNVDQQQTLIENEMLDTYDRLGDQSDRWIAFVQIFQQIWKPINHQHSIKIVLRTKIRFQNS